jgi:amidohydrolase
VIDADKLLELTQQLQPQLVSWRRDFHQYPELAFQEFRSSECIIQQFKALQYDPITGIAETGLIARIEGQQRNPSVMLRFDMDALPIREETGADYASKNDGVMHACGHDGHMAIGLGVASVLRDIQDELPGSAVLLFQPAEEGAGGAQRMIADGALNSAAPDYALGMHIWNDKPLEWLGLPRDVSMAGADSFKITLSGKGGHGALPHLAHDPILAAAHLITALQSIISRNLDPLQSAVLSVTQIQGGDAFNVIPSEVELLGTIRCFTAETRELILEEFQRITTLQAQSFQCQAEIDIQEITPPLVNEESIVERITFRIKELVPELDIDEDCQVLGSEDMALFLEKVPGCYFFLGSANAERKLDAPHHNPRFDFDETVLSQAVYLCVQAAIALMENE